MCLGQRLAVVLSTKGELNGSPDRTISLLDEGVFRENIAGFRVECLAWLNGLSGWVPRDINILLFHGGDFFFNRVSRILHLRMQLFAVVLYFFHVNGAPITLRQRFWCLLLSRPCMSEDLMVDGHGSYASLFRFFSQVSLDFILKMGGMYRVELQSDGVVSGWGAYNIWGCRGFYDGNRGGFRRMIESSILFVTLDLGVIDWHYVGLFTPAIEVKDGVDFYPGLSSYDENSIEYPQCFFE